MEILPQYLVFLLTNSSLAENSATPAMQYPDYAGLDPEYEGKLLPF